MFTSVSHPDFHDFLSDTLSDFQPSLTGLCRSRAYRSGTAAGKVSHETRRRAMGALRRLPSKKLRHIARAVDARSSRLFLVEQLPGVGINEGDIAGLLVPPHQVPDGRLKPVGVAKFD